MKRKMLGLAWFWLAFLLLIVACQRTPAPVVEVEEPDAPAALEEVAATVELEAEPTAAVSPEKEPAAGPLYWDASQPIDARVADLLSQMTLEEKIGQMTLVEKGSIRADDIATMGIGALLSGGGGSPQENTPAGWLEMVNGYQEYALQSRLGIPLLYGVDAVHGHNNVVGATIFPHNIGLGATRNPELVREIGRVTAIETAATGIYWDYAPVLAVPQDIRWGRVYEGYSENTQVVTELGIAYLLGLQSWDGQTADLSHPETILATPKHWVADGGTAWGSSTTSNYKIDQGDAQMDEATLRTVHMAPYIAAVENGAQSVMVSYSSWNGVKLHSHDYLINKVLKEELDFGGFVVSDWEAINQINPDYYTAVVTAINAGVDMNMVPYDYRTFMAVMLKAVEAGDIPMNRIDDAVSRILRVKFELGLFERPLADESLLAEVGSAAHREVARQAVRESLVLLQNTGGALPLNEAAISTIFVAGEAADDIGMQSGGWTIEWQGQGGEITAGTTLLEAVEAAVSPETDVYFDRFGKFADITDAAGNAVRADVGLVVLGERPYAEGVGDRDDLSLNPTIIERVAEQAEIVIVILYSGRPLIITEALPLADAWVAAWLPGTEGAGITDVLFGEYPFTGKLSYSWPRSMAQLPFDFTNLAAEGCEAPLFPFGYGLTTADVEPVEILDCP